MPRRDPTLHLAKGVLALLSRLPESALRRIAGPQQPVRGQVPHPEVAAALRLLHAVPGSSFEDLPLEQARQQLRDEAWAFGAQVDIPRVRDLVMRRAGRPDLPMRLYEPRADGPARGLMIWFHGGGWVLGDLETNDPAARFLAREADMALLVVDYRLAPEHPYPAAVEDTLDAYRYAVQHAAEWGYDPQAVMAGGDSAGGNLTAVLSQQVRDLRRAGEQELPSVAYALLFYPVTDLSRQRESYRTYADGYFLTTRQMDWYTERYTPDPASRLEPAASPILASDLTDLPPTYVGVAGFDPLRDEAIEYAQKLRAAGNDVVLDVDEGHTHGFVNATGAGKTGRAAVRRACAALHRHLTG